MNKVLLEHIGQVVKENYEKVCRGRYLITGATGNIAEYIIRLLLNIEGVEIVAMCHSIEKGNIVYSDLIGSSRLRLVQHDVLCEVNEEYGLIDYVIHTAGICNNYICKQSPEKVIETNISGTKNILEYAKRSGVKKFCFISSASVYGSLSSDLYCEYEQGLIDFGNVNNAYAYSKRIGELLCHMYEEYFPVVIVRPFHIIESGMIKEKSSMLGSFFNRASCNKDIIINTQGTQKRNFTFVIDVAMIIILLTATGRGVYNIGNPNGTEDVLSMAKIVRDTVNKSVNIKCNNEWSAKPSNNIDMVPNLNRLKAFIEDYQFFDVAEAIKICIEVLETEA